MQRVANGTQLPALPALAAEVGSPGYFGITADGAPAPTIVDRDWLNTLQEEILNVILAASITPNGSVRTQLLAAIQALIAAGANGALVDSGTANTYVVTPGIPLAGYAFGDTLVFKAAHTNTGPSTLNASALGAVPIVHRDGGALQAGDIPLGALCRCVHDGTNFQLEDAIPTLATTNLEGLVKLATNAMAQAGTDAASAVTPAALAAAALLLSGGTITGPVTFDNTIGLNSTAASSLLTALGFSWTSGTTWVQEIPMPGGRTVIRQGGFQSVGDDGMATVTLPVTYPNAVDWAGATLVSPTLPAPGIDGGCFAFASGSNAINVGVLTTGTGPITGVYWMTEGH